jgi:hypothetical protein
MASMHLKGLFHMPFSAVCANLFIAPDIARQRYGKSFSAEANTRSTKEQLLVASSTRLSYRVQVTRLVLHKTSCSKAVFYFKVVPFTHVTSRICPDRLWSCLYLVTNFPYVCSRRGLLCNTKCIDFLFIMAKVCNGIDGTAKIADSAKTNRLT